jgi:hypothetical protein
MQWTTLPDGSTRAVTPDGHTLATRPVAPREGPWGASVVAAHHHAWSVLAPDGREIAGSTASTAEPRLEDAQHLAERAWPGSAEPELEWHDSVEGSWARTPDGTVLRTFRVAPPEGPYDVAEPTFGWSLSGPAQPSEADARKAAVAAWAAVARTA